MLGTGQVVYDCKQEGSSPELRRWVNGTPISKPMPVITKKNKEGQNIFMDRIQQGDHGSTMRGQAYEDHCNTGEC
jgi:hypothetical protein